MPRLEGRNMIMFLTAKQQPVSQAKKQTQSDSKT